MNNTSNTGIASAHAAGDHGFALAAKRGDERAFGILFERYQHKIFALALRYTRVPEDAEDIVQQTFQKAFIHLHQFEGKSSFYTWLTRIAVNEALMLLRKGRAVRDVLIEDSSEQHTATRRLEIPHSSSGPEANYLKREEAELLSAAISELKPRTRRVIELREFAQLSTRETARYMGLSVGAVKARVFQGRKKLRRSLQRLGFAPRGLQRLTLAT
jgi:RNA polymerase sigma-70 factor (ECF subfamily)